MDMKLGALSVTVLSALLAGCGGGDSGGSSGGTTTVVTDNITLTFVEMETGVSSVPSGCTVFDEDSTAGTYTYAKLASDLTVNIYKADGSFQETLTPGSSGTLTVDKYDIEDGGYLSVIDSPSSTDPYYKVLSIQKELLESQLIEITRNQGDVSCYTSDSAPATNTGSVIISNTTGETVTQYQYLSSEEDSGLTTNNSYEITAVSGESVLVKGYNGTTLNTYALVDTLGTSASPELVSLGTLDTTYTWTDSVGATNTLASLNILLGNGNYTYDWESPDVTTTPDFDIQSTETDWFYNAQGTLENGLAFRINDTLGSSLDVLIPSTLTISASVVPVIELDSGTYQVNVGDSVESTEELIVRTKYTQTSSTSSETLEHVIMGVSSGGNIIIPDLTDSGSITLLPDTSSNPEVDVFEVASVEGDFQQALISQFEGEDTVAVVITPADELQHQYYLNTSSYVQVSQ